MRGGSEVVVLRDGMGLIGEFVVESWQELFGGE